MFTLTRAGSIAVLTMQHGKANALDTEFCKALAAEFEKLGKSDARAVVLTAQGKIFSAGVDLLRATTSGPNYFRSFLPALDRLYRTIFFFPKPVVAAVNGHAIAGGCILACAADRRLLARGDGRMGVTELLVGLPFPPLAFEIMRYVTAPARFPQVIYTGTTFPSKEALALGLADELVAPERLLEDAMGRAEQLAALRPEAFAITKRQMRRPVLDALKRHRGSEQAATKVWLKRETAASIRDYVARTFKKG
ncbi:MAG TPA: enoyl-CoA hydratase/isomerase family protein [Xanthobacteraceae bacterium]